MSKLAQKHGKFGGTGVPFPTETPNEFAYMDFAKYVKKNEKKMIKFLKPIKPDAMFKAMQDLWSGWDRKANKGAFSNIKGNKFGRELALKLRKDGLLFKSTGNKITNIKEFEGKLNEKVDYMYLTQVILDAKPKHNVYYNSGHNKVNIGGVGYDKGGLVQNFNQKPGSSSKIKNNFYYANQDPENTKKEVEKLSRGKIKVDIQKGYGGKPVVVYIVKEGNKITNIKEFAGKLYEASNVWKMFDAKMKLQDSIIDLEDEMRDITNDLKQLHRDMEQEAEPGGGKIADKYGRQIEKKEKEYKKKRAEFKKLMKKLDKMEQY